MTLEAYPLTVPELIDYLRAFKYNRMENVILSYDDRQRIIGALSASS